MGSLRTASPRRFSRVPTIYVLIRNMKNISVFLSENVQFLEVKISIYLKRHVFVMFSMKTYVVGTHLKRL